MSHKRAEHSSSGFRRLKNCVLKSLVLNRLKQTDRRFFEALKLDFDHNPSTIGVL